MVDGVLDNGLTLNSIPANEWLLKVGTRLPSYDLTIGWQTRITAAQLSPGADTDAYTLHNIFATYKPDSGALDGWEVRAEINNIFDVQYIAHLNAVTGGDVARGLSASLSIGRSF